MEYNNLLELIKTVSESNLSVFRYEEGDTKIVLSTGEEAVSHMEMGDAKIKEPPKKTEPTDTTNLRVVTSPLVGTFYVAPAEDAAPFVTIGDTVKKGQTLAIVEAMKLMNDIESDYEGTVAEIYVKNGESVEYNQPLFAIR